MRTSQEKLPRPSRRRRSVKDTEIGMGGLRGLGGRWGGQDPKSNAPRPSTVAIEYLFPIRDTLRALGGDGG